MNRKAIYLLRIVAVGLAIMLGAPLANAQGPDGPGDRPSGWVKDNKQLGATYSPLGVAINRPILSRNGNGVHDEDENKDADGEIGE